MPLLFLQSMALLGLYNVNLTRFVHVQGWNYRACQCYSPNRESTGDGVAMNVLETAGAGLFNPGACDDFGQCNRVGTPHSWDLPFKGSRDSKSATCYNPSSLPFMELWEVGADAP